MWGALTATKKPDVYSRRKNHMTSYFYDDQKSIIHRECVCVIEVILLSFSIPVLQIECLEKVAKAI